ncbi:MAG: signal peptidase II [Gemmatimonadales bacterium]
MASGVDRRPPFWGLVAIVVVLDRITKILAERALGAGESISVVGETAQLRLVHNPGAAFGLNLGDYSRWIFMVVAIVAIVFLFRMWRETAVADRLRLYALGFVAGGAAGNLIDRFISPRGVVDFIDVGVSGLPRWPTFNVADIAVSCGAVALALSLWREDARRAAAVVPPT